LAEVLNVHANRDQAGVVELRVAPADDTGQWSFGAIGHELSAQQGYTNPVPDPTDAFFTVADEPGK